LEEKAAIKEITKFKKFFKDREFSEKEKEAWLRGDYGSRVSEAEVSFNEDVYKHQIILDQDTQELYLECKSIVEDELERPVRNKTELFTLILSDFYINNSK
jgi:hypothetical protein